MGNKQTKKTYSNLCNYIQLFSKHQTLRHFNMTCLLQFLNTTKSTWIQMLWSQSYWLFFFFDSQSTFIPKLPIYPALNIKHWSLHEGEAFNWTASLTIIAHVKDENAVPRKDTTSERLTNHICITSVALAVNMYICDSSNTDLTSGCSTWTPCVCKMFNSEWLLIVCFNLCTTTYYLNHLNQHQL